MRLDLLSDVAENMVTATATKPGSLILMDARPCTHRLHWPQEMAASGAFKIRCCVCEVVAYREHPLTGRIYRALNFDGMGITLALVFLMGIAFLPWPVGTVAIASVAAYLYDVRQLPLQVFTNSESQAKHRTEKLC